MFYYIIALTAFVVIVAVVLPGMGIVGLLRPAIGDDRCCATFFEKVMGIANSAGPGLIYCVGFNQPLDKSSTASMSMGKSLVSRRLGLAL